MDKLTARQLAAIDALLTAPTIGAAAAAAGVGRRTLERWLHDASFCARLRQAGDERIAATVRRLASAAGQAVDVLMATMDDGAPSLRLRAADLTLGHGARLRELHEIERRIAALEARHG